MNNRITDSNMKRFRPSQEQAIWLSLAFAALVVAGCGRGNTEATSEKERKVLAEPVVVTVSNLMPRPIQRRVTIVGSFLGREEVTISPEVDGRIIRIHHDVGEVVQPGELLLEVTEVLGVPTMITSRSAIIKSALAEFQFPVGMSEQISQAEASHFQI
jgi:multidrug efflux pump subunit AcrA (membrane-fusion protein)